MKECVQSYYIRDGQIEDCRSFQLGMINEGKSIYEVTRLLGTRLLFIEDHLDRLVSSLKMEGIEPWLTREDILVHLGDLIHKNPAREGNVKIVMNLGPSGEKHFLAYFVHHRYPSVKDYKNGVKVITFPFERLYPNKKIWRPDFRREVNDALNESGAFEALLTDSKGLITEASKANIFAVRKDAVITPPDGVVLPGITRAHILKICCDLRIPVIYKKLDLKELPLYEVLFLSGTSPKILPVSRVNEMKIPIYSPVLKMLTKKYEYIIQNYIT
jgi:branched-chain amino acid aminotransferase